ncbi:MAG: PSD1 domain-containing protein [Planctomycetaceae bacterium]|nr:PSD1 domain-containing protein [Planctomycetaceae bacterium]
MTAVRALNPFALDPWHSFESRTSRFSWTPIANPRRVSQLGMILIAVSAIAFLSRSVDAAPVEYQRDIEPLLKRHCLKCHGPQKQQGGLRLDVRESAFQGGDSGEPAMVPLNAAGSRLMHLVASKDENERMPPEGDPLSADQIEKLRRWIDGGAVWPQSNGPVAAASSELVITEEDRQHWSFLPLQDVTPPQVQDEKWVQTPVDQFILQRLEESRLVPNPPAETRTLMRRAYFDLIGLPPQWNGPGNKQKEERLGVELADPGVGLPPVVVSKLLASDHYGERWARHWLDVARYADSSGMESDHDRPNAYHFRDFVIRALNGDMPFNQFVQWQLAGDELAPDNPDAIAATGFIVAGFSQLLNVPMEEEKLRLRANELDDMVSTTGQALLGLTLGCCRCHDHKYDPITSRDYYRLTRIFHSGDRRDVPLASPTQVREHQKKLSVWQAEYDSAVKTRDEWLKTARRPFAEEMRVEKIGRLPLDDAQKKRLIESPDDADAKKLAGKFRKELAISDADYVAMLPETKQKTWGELDAAVRAAAKRKPTDLPMAFAFADFAAEPPDSWFFERGDFLARREKMEFGFLTVLVREKSADAYWQAARENKLRDDSTQQRRALAEWMTDIEHGAGALLARVMVNRIWQQHFGQGLVRTPNDFGTRGERPTHPELLEWLAGEFVNNGWSIKHLHQLIVNSATYQQASSHDESKAAMDPDNHLLWRFRPRRLEAEALRDTMLAAAGTLNHQMYGPSFKPPIAPEAMQARNVKSPYPRDVKDGPENRRRSVYLFHKRVIQYPLMQAFDAPDAQVSCGRRMNTTVAPQALALLNDPFVRLRAEELARRVASESGDNLDARLRRAFLLTVSREPEADELTSLQEFVRNQMRSRRQREKNIDDDTLSRAALTDLCQSLFGLNEFIYVD